MSIAAKIPRTIVVTPPRRMDKIKSRSREYIFQNIAQMSVNNFPLRSGPIFSDRQACNCEILVSLPRLTKRPDGLKEEFCGYVFPQVNDPDWIPCVSHYLPFHPSSCPEFFYRNSSHSLCAFPQNFISLLDCRNFEII